MIGNMRKIIIVVLALAIVLGFLFWKFAPNFSEKPVENKEVTLNFWGLWEDETLIKPAIDEYKKIKPNVTVNYKFQGSVNYSSRVQTQIKEGEGPDILMIHNSWLPVFLQSNSLSAMPESVMKFEEYKNTFYPVARDTLTSDGKIYGISRGVDGLALYYNEDILNAAGILVPQTWDQFVQAATKVTVIDQTGQIQTAGAALGGTGNIDHWSDILGLLYLQQPGADLEKPNNEAGVEILKFYTNFITDPAKKVWDTNMENSTQAFASGRLAFYFAPSWRAHELRQLNPELKFKTAPVPQLPGKTVGWGTFWAYAVSPKSTAQTEAWEFLKYLTGAEAEKQLYQKAAEVRLFGLPYSRVDLQKEIAEDPFVGAFVNQGPSYKSWYLASNTLDKPGINDSMIKYYEDAVNAVLQGQNPQVALDTAADGVAQVLNQYFAPAAVPSQ